MAADPIPNPRPIDWATIAAHYYQQLPGLRAEVMAAIDELRVEMLLEFGKLNTEVRALKGTRRPGDMPPRSRTTPPPALTALPRSPTGGVIMTEEEARSYLNAYLEESKRADELETWVEIKKTARTVRDKVLVGVLAAVILGLVGYALTGHIHLTP